MQAPQTFFIDTSVFERMNYNFSSQVFESLIAATKTGVMLLPQVTELEVRRHMRERFNEAVTCLAKARKEAEKLIPFYSGVNIFPPDLSPFTFDVHKNSLDRFLNKIKVKRLGVKEIDLSEVIRQWDKRMPPFAVGKKEKEFPDAFALSSIIKYAKDNNETIAVISGDVDFEGACEKSTKLLYFNSLQDYLELSIPFDEKLDAVRDAISRSSKLDEAISDSIYEVDVCIDSPGDGDEADFENVSVTCINDIKIIGVSKGKYSFSFESIFDYSVRARLYEYYDDEEIGSVEQRWKGSASITGFAKIKMDSAFTEVEEVICTELNKRAIDISMPNEYYEE